MAKHPDKKHYNFLKYDSQSRWASYWHQINEILNLNPKNVLEVGIGNSTVYHCLKNHGVKITSLDIDKNLEPDVLGDMLNMPFKNNSFDIVLCAEVLEHIPFDKFNRGLSELKRVSKRHVVLSLPHFGHAIKLGFKIPLIKEKKFAVKFSFFPEHQFNGEHYWEIGKKGYPFSKIKKTIEQYFVIKKEFVPFDNQYHHFFVLEKL